MKAEEEEHERRMWEINRKVRDGLPRTEAEMAAWHQWQQVHLHKPASSSSSSTDKRKKRRKRRRPRASSLRGTRLQRASANDFAGVF